ncbi:MAG TPA: NB-ARC domain-containing protein, partial [Candidatus Limnocylindrales bacterium]
MVAGMPDPGGSRSLDELVERLKLLKIWAGDPSYEAITDRINAAWTGAGRPRAELARRGTVVDCFKPGRRRVNADLLVAVVEALHPDTGYVIQWRRALSSVLGETRAAAQVKAQDRLPGDLADFTGRTAELERLLSLGKLGEAMLATIEGMAGVGKTQLAIRAGHLLAAEQAFDHVLFVGLRGFHPDPAQPPADPAAVLDSFLRLLGRSGQQIPHDLGARAALFRKMLTGQRVLLVLDDAADAEQIRPLLPGGPGCITLVTSRRRLIGVPVPVRLVIEVFSADEAVELLKRTAPDVPVGRDPHALDRVAHRCGYLPLALSLLAARMRTATGWTLTDHADRLDERHREQRLDSGVELALGISYEHLPPEHRRLLRLLALHPGPDFDGYAAATLAGADNGTAVEGLR